MGGILKGGSRQGHMACWWAAMGMGTVRVKGGLHGIPFTKDVQDEHHAGSETAGAHVLRCCRYGGRHLVPWHAAKTGDASTERGRKEKV